MKKLIIYFLLLLALPASLLADATKTVGTSGADYPTLNEAFFDINNGTIQGVIILQIIDNITESATAELFESGYGGLSNYTSVTIYPTGSGFKINGPLDAPLISLNGALNVTIDGRLNATGSAKDLIITNESTGTSASTIQFINDATNNTIKYCIIKGSETSTTSGVIFFSTAGAGSGNDGNTIDNNDITSDVAGRPINTIYSFGTSGQENSGNTISSNDIKNFLKNGAASNGVYLSSNTTTWTISGNNFYETASFAPGSSVTYTAIRIDNTSGTGFIVTGNFIGGQSAACGGSAWTKTTGISPFYNNAFFAIYLNVGSGTASSVQSNTIKNFNWSNSSSAGWTGIHIAAGAVNIGTSTGNTIGATSGTGSITLTGGATGTNLFGINITSTGTVDCQFNSFGSITASAALNTLAVNITGINKTGTGTTTISNNIIGSTSTSSSINATSGGTSNAQAVIGIISGGSGTITINSNTIANMTNGASSSSASSRGRINGIISSNGSNTISNNTIRDLTISNANDASNQTASVCAIGLTGITFNKTVTGNVIYNLSNTYSTFVGSVIGLFYSGSTGTNNVNGNFIHSLSVTGASSSTASIYGIFISTGATTYSNNIISLGGNTKTIIYGIYETGASGNNNNLYFNTVYIGGNGSGGTNKSYALYSAVNTNTRDFRNNIFVNARSTTSGSNLHYAAYIVSAGGAITCDYNDYLVSGASVGGILGFYAGNVTTLPIVTGQDVNSFAIDPVFAVPGGTVAANYIPSAATLVAVTGTGITTDYAGTTRSISFPSMGAYEYTVSGSWTWTGATSTNWSTASNWNYNTVPSTSGNAIITNVGFQPIVNEAPATPAQCVNLTINTGAVLTVAAGKALKVTGTLTNNAGNTGLVIKSEANGNDGKLINNTPSVPGTVELFLKGGTVSSARVYHYFVPPVQSMTIGSTIAIVKTNLGVANFSGDLLSYSESAAGAIKDNGWQFFDGWNGTTGFSTIVSSAGYNINFPADDKMTFKGTLNGAAHTFSGLSFTSQGWNLVGNPYPCNYDLSGVNALTATGDNIDNTVYFNHDGGYAFWNVELGTGTTGYSSIMPPMQGFFVHVTSTGTSLSLPVGSKTAGTAGPLRSKGFDISDSKGATPVKKIKLVLNNGVVPDETIVCLVDKATSGFDSDYDAYKLFGSTNLPAIYTVLNSVKYALNSVQEPAESASMIIPVTIIIKNAGTYKIDISEFENLDGVNVVLKHGADETILSKNVSYSFTSAAGTFSNFELIIGNNNTPAVAEPVTNEKLKAWYSNRIMFINYPEGLSYEKSSLIIYDIQGKMVFNDKVSLTPGQTIQIPINLPKGLYVVHINISSQPVVTKIVVF